MKHILIPLLLFFISNNLFAQTVTVKGSISYHSENTPDALIILKSNQDTTKLISNRQGEFYGTIHYQDNDTLQITAYKEGYSSISRKYTSPEEFIDKEIALEFAEQIYVLPEVNISGNKNIIQKANKIIYKISSKEFLRHTATDTALKRIPQLSVSSSGIKLNNTREVLIFIDDMEASFEDLRHIDIDDVEKVEVISNPSSFYGSEFAGGIIKIIKKERNENFLKGDIELAQGIRLKKRYILPTLSYKNKYLQFSAFYYYTTNNQNSVLKDKKQYADQTMQQQTLEDHINGWQEFLSANLKLYLGEKTWFIAKIGNSRYKFHTNAVSYMEQNQDSLPYKKTEKVNNMNISGLLHFSLNSNKDLIWKGSYLSYKTGDSNSYANGNMVTSKINEYSTEMTYTYNNINWLQGTANASIAYKYIYRNFEYGGFKPQQSIHSLYASLDYSINDFSAYISLPFESTYNKNPETSQHYNNFLPTISVLYKLKSHQTLSAEYSKRIIRPGSEYLNDTPITINPLYIKKGNPDLLPQILQSIRLNYNKEIGKEYTFFANAEYQNYKNCISETMARENESTIYTYNNLGKRRIAGTNIGGSLNFFNGLHINTNLGYRYNQLSTKDNQAIVQENSGSSFNCSLNASSLIKKKVQVSLDLTYISHIYSLTTTLRNNPIMSIGIETNLLKDKLTLSLNYSDMFSLNATSKSSINTRDYSQYSVSTNRMTNLTFTLIFRFGRTFRTDIHENGINNHDLLLKR